MKKSIVLFMGIICLILCLNGCGEVEKDIKLPKVTAAMQELSGNTLKDGFYGIEGDTLKVMLVFDKQVLMNGPCKLIRDSLLEQVGNQYEKIDLTIKEKVPETNFVKYKYEDNKWERQ